jgi:3-dehydroquinate synthase
MILEYGHTVGHAIEKLSFGGLTHGEAVAVGMVAAARISHEMGLLSAAEVARHRHILGKLMGIDLRIPSSLSSAQILETIAADNKRTCRGVRWVLLEQIGAVHNPTGDYLTDVDRILVTGILDEMRHEPQG